MKVSSPWDCALRYLGQRGHSQFELEQKLTRRGFTAEEVEQTIARLDSGGLLDDTQFAIDLTRSLIENRGIAYRSIVRKLHQKGVDEKSIEIAMAQVSTEDDYVRALSTARHRLGQGTGGDWPVRRRRLLAFLGRRGFPDFVCFQVIRQLESDNDLA